MDAKEAFKTLSHLRSVFLNSILSHVNENVTIGDQNIKELRFELYDYNFVVRTDINAFKQTGFIHTYLIKDDLTSLDAKILVKIDDLDVTIKIVDGDRGSQVPASFFDSDSNLPQNNIENNSRFTKQYFNILESFLKK